jgi:uncharacterized protein
MWKSVDEVARAGIDGLAADKGLVVPGRVNWLLTRICRVVPHEALMPLLAQRAPVMKRN